MSDVTTPRLVYRGAADETAETREAVDQIDLDAALKAGWRLTRVDATHPAPEPDAADEPAAAETPAEAPKPATAKKPAKAKKQ